MTHARPLRLALAVALAVAPAVAPAVAQQVPKLAPAPKIPLGKQIVVVAQFQSPDTVRCGDVVARLASAALYRALETKFPVRLLPDVDPSVDPTAVADTVRHEAERENGMYLVTGDYFVDGDRITIQPRVSFLSASGMSDMVFGLEYQADIGPMIARTDLTEFLFSPVTLRVEDLVAGAGATDLRIDPKPDASSIGSYDPQAPASVTDEKSGWIRVQRGNGMNGWMPAGPGDAEKSLAVFKPMADFVGAMELFVSGDYAGADRGATAWINDNRSGEKRVTVMFADLLAGTARLRALPNPTEFPRNESITTAYLAARTVAPDQPSTVDYLMIARLLKYLMQNGGKPIDRTPELVETEEMLIQSIRNNWNERTITNLQGFYQLAGDFEFLRTKEVEDTTYTNQLNTQLSTLTETQEQIRPGSGRVILIVKSALRPPSGTTSVRFGVWSPKEHELALVLDGVTFDKEFSTVEQGKPFGLDIHIRNRIIYPVHFDVSFAAWYSTYKFKNLDSSFSALRTLDTWALLIPLTIGISVTTFPESMFQPYITGGGGALVAFEARSYTPSTLKLKDEDSRVHFSLGGYIGAGIDVMLSRNFGLSIGAKYQFTHLKEALYTGQKDFSGLQILGGVATGI